MTHGLGFQALRWSQYGHTLKMHLILEKKNDLFTSTAAGDKRYAWL